MLTFVAAPQLRVSHAPIMTAEAPPPVAPPPVAAPPRDAAWNPLGLFGCKAAPAYLDGTYAGDVGFDPLCLVALAMPTPDLLKGLLWVGDRTARMDAMSESEQRAAVSWMRTAELKHGRLAMLCAAGWPLAEIANGAALRELGTNGRALSVLNGGLFDSGIGLAAFYIFVIASIADSSGAFYGQNGGNYEFDPLGVASGEGPLPSYLPNVGKPEQMALAEIKNGRLAMVAVTGYAFQEWVWGTPIIKQTPYLFGAFGSW